MNNSNNNQKLINEILKMSGGDSRMKQGLSSDNIEDIINSLPENQSEKLQELLKNPEATKALLNSPKAKALLQALLGTQNG